MEQAPILNQLLRTESGRLRLGWRLVLFAVITVVVAAVTTAFFPTAFITAQAALLVGAVSSGVLLLRLDRRPAGALGFYTRRAAISEASLGLGLGTVVALAVVALMAAAGGLRWTAQDGSVFAWFVGSLGALAFLAIPAAAEEALLRGYPLQALAEVYGPWAAIIVTAIVFGALHLFNPNLTFLGMVNITLAGVFLSVLYLRTGSLWWATGAHLGWNWAHGYIVDVPVSGLELLDAPVYNGVLLGPEWLSGGAFGPEGSLITTLVVVVAIVVCLRTPALGPSDAATEAQPLVIMVRNP